MQDLLDFITQQYTFTLLGVQYVNVSRDNVGAIATRYGLDGPGIESRLRRGFPHPSRPALGTIQPPVKQVLDIFNGGKDAGAWS